MIAKDLEMFTEKMCKEIDDFAKNIRKQTQKFIMAKIPVRAHGSTLMCLMAGLSAQVIYAISASNNSPLLNDFALFCDLTEKNIELIKKRGEKNNN